jgi:hypothetical protein
MDYQETACKMWAELDGMWKPGSEFMLAHPEFGDAYRRILSEGIVQRWCGSVSANNRDEAYRAATAPLAGDLRVLSNSQRIVMLKAIDGGFGGDERLLWRAIEDFGQTVLQDPKTGVIPQMSGSLGFSLWYAIMRACSLHGIEARFWSEASIYLGVAFDLYKRKPPPKTGRNTATAGIGEIRREWESMSPEERDRAFHRFAAFYHHCASESSIARPAVESINLETITTMAQIDDLQKEIEALRRELENTRRALEQKGRYVVLGFFKEALDDKSLPFCRTAGMPIRWQYWDDTPGANGYIWLRKGEAESAIPKLKFPAMGAREFTTEEQARQWVDSKCNDFANKAESIALLAVTDFYDPVTEVAKSQYKAFRVTQRE